jgi:DNA polymerase
MTAQEYVPERGGIEELRQAAKGCRGCDLYKDAIQTVFGEGPDDARILVVGEQPGDVEDRRGAPFVGPAGKLLDRAAADDAVLVATVHPSAVLRADDRDGAFKGLVEDLRALT